MKAVQQKPNLWYISETIGGKRKRYYGKTEQAVWAAYYEAQTQANGGITFGHVAKEFEAVKFQSLVEGSIRSLSPALKSAVERFGSTPIVDITANDVSVYVKWLEARYAYKTVKNYLSMVRQVIDYGIVEMRINMHNPCQSVRVTNRDKQETREPPTPEQIDEIKKTTPDEFLLAFVILYTGCRLGEALALQLKDINKTKYTISVNKAVHFRGNTPYVAQLKTVKSKRTIPYLKPLEDMISQLKRKPDDYIVSGSELLTMSAVNRRWAYYCLDHNMGHRRERIKRQNGKVIRINEVVADIDRHQLRHEFATMCFEAGLDVKTVQGILGHADFSTTMNIYTHWREKKLDDAREKLNAAFY